jgi:hypothetical protein
MVLSGLTAASNADHATLVPMPASCSFKLTESIDHCNKSYNSSSPPETLAPVRGNGKMAHPCHAD